MTKDQQTVFLLEATERKNTMDAKYKHIIEGLKSCGCELCIETISTIRDAIEYNLRTENEKYKMVLHTKAAKW